MGLELELLTISIVVVLKLSYLKLRMKPWRRQVLVGGNKGHATDVQAFAKMIKQKA